MIYVIFRLKVFPSAWVSCNNKMASCRLVTLNIGFDLVDLLLTFQNSLTAYVFIMLDKNYTKQLFFFFFLKNFSLLITRFFFFKYNLRTARLCSFTLSLTKNIQINFQTFKIYSFSKSFRLIFFYYNLWTDLYQFKIKKFENFFEMHFNAL